MDTTKNATNLFAASVQVKQPATAKKAEKKIFPAPELADKIAAWSKLKGELDAITAQVKMLEGDIKAKGRGVFMEQYLKQKSTPDNFLIQDNTKATCMMIVMDKYTLVDENKAELLKEFDGLLAEKIVYQFNAELVEKYGAILSEMICSSPNIDAEDKGRLITGEKSFSVAKGSIDRLMQFEAPEQVFELINPIVSLKK